MFYIGHTILNISILSHVFTLSFKFKIDNKKYVPYLMTAYQGIKAYNVYVESTDNE